jgi:hypothetical protein
VKLSTIAGGAAVTVIALVALVVGYGALEDATAPAAPPVPAAPAATTVPAALVADARGFLYGRVTIDAGETHEGRLRWGGNEEAFWSDYFNGEKEGNPWAAHVPAERRTRTRPVEILGLEVFQRQESVDLDRLFMARFGDLARVEAPGADRVVVTLKSGTVFELDRFQAGDFDDGVRVWREDGGHLDFGTRGIRAVDFLAGAAHGAVPDRLHGTVRTRRGAFTGFVQWDREECVGSDTLDGRSADGEVAVPFATVRAIARRQPGGVQVTLRDGRELVLEGGREVGGGNRGIYVDDPRYGRVLVSWAAFERLELSDPAAVGSGPGYDDFPPGAPLTGAVTTRDGRRVEGRLVYDLDESETTETLDAPAAGVDYTIPFGLVAAIVLPPSTEGDAPHARVTLHGGEELRLELAGDLGARNLGLLVFAGPDPGGEGGEGGERAEHVPWTEVERIDFERPPAMYPPLGGR